MNRGSLFVLGRRLFSMSLKAKLEAVVYAAEEPVTLAQLAVIFADEVLPLLDQAAEPEAEQIALTGLAPEENEQRQPPSHQSPSHQPQHRGYPGLGGTVRLQRKPERATKRNQHVCATAGSGNTCSRCSTS